MNYLFKAVDSSGKVLFGEIEGANETEVRRKLQQQGFAPQSVAPNTVQTTGSVGGTPAIQTVSVPAGKTLMGAPNTSTMALQNTAISSQTVAAQQNGTRVGGITVAGNAARIAAQTARTQAALTRAQPAVSAAVPAESTLGGVTTRDMMLFFRQFASLAHSGISLYGALENLAARTPNRNLAQTVREMAQAAHSGARISDVMAHYPRIYPEHIVGTVRAGELGGFLEIVLAEIALNYEQNIALYRGAWIPKMMATQALFALALVLPLFPSLFASMDIAANVRLYVLREAIILPLTGVLYYGIKFGSRRLQLPQFRRLRDSWALRMPTFGDLQRQAALAAFVRMLRRLYQAGVSPIQAWEGATNTASNVVIREKLEESYARMQQGASLPDAFTATGLFAGPVEQLLLTGHQSGQVIESLDHAAEIYQDQVQQAAGKARFMMLRLGILAMLILGGVTMLWLTHSYFDGIFHFMDSNFGD